jgi:hypothetical protein
MLPLFTMAGLDPAILFGGRGRSHLCFGQAIFGFLCCHLLF